MKNCDGENDGCKNKNSYPCECNFLKPLNIEALFFNSNDNEMCDVLNKTKKIRDGYFTVKTALKNFTDGCALLLDELNSTAEKTPQLMYSIRNSYLKTLDTLTFSIFGALSVTYNNKPILNVAYSKFSNKEFKLTPKCTLLELKKYKCEDSTIILTVLPGFLVKYNIFTKKLSLKVRESNSAALNKSSGLKTENVITEYVIAPAITLNDNDLSGNDISGNILLPDDGSDDIFDGADEAEVFLEEIANNEELDGVNDAFNNEIFQLNTLLDNNILKIENVHKYVVQICKIESS